MAAADLTIPFDEQQEQGSETPQERARREAEEAEAVKSALIEATSTPIQRTASPEIERFELVQRMAKLFAMSGCFGEIKNKTVTQAIAEAFTKIAIGEGMGFTPAQSMMGIDIIQGRPAVGAHLRAARMQQLGYDWQIDWFGTEEKCTGCRLWLFFKGQPVLQPKRDDDGNPLFGDDGKVLMQQVSVSFREWDAKRMMTKIWDQWDPPTKKNKPRTASILEKDNWKNNPSDMYFARCITRLQRRHVARAISSNVLDLEEAREVIDLEAIPAENPMPALTPADFDRKHGARIEAAREANRQHPAQTSDRNERDNPTPKRSEGVQQDSTESERDVQPAGNGTTVKSSTPSPAGSEKPKQQGFGGFGKTKKQTEYPD